MSEKYSISKLCSLQDHVLGLISDIDHSFYLTGGTALGRHYLEHRYSDDLDLFVNRKDNFRQLTDTILSRLRLDFPEIEEDLLGADFARVFIPGKEIRLKVEFVNDVVFHAGEIQGGTFFHRIDSWENILSNKISALTRDEPKDIADLIFLSRKYEFNWKQMIDFAREEDKWVNEIEVSKVFYDFETQRLSEINWTGKPEYSFLGEACRIIASDIIRGKENSLAGKK